MRVLIVSVEFPPGPGGIGTHAYQVAKHLQRLGWEVTVLTKQEYATEEAIRDFNQSQTFRIITVRSQLLKWIKFVHWLQKASSLARGWRPDAVLASGISAVLVAGLVARFYRIALMVVAHGEFPAGWQLAWMRWSCRQAKALVCVSEYTRQQMRLIGLRSAGTTVIENGGDHDLFRPLSEQEIHDFRTGLGMTDARILLTVGKVSRRKGQDIVIRALPHILKSVPNTHYFIVGLPACRTQFARLAKELGVSEFVHFAGAIDTMNLVRFLNACDIFVMLSRHANRQYEGYGIAVVEAALCRKPAVVTANSGVRESIVPGITGFAVPEGDSIAAADAIVTLLQNDQLTSKFGEGAQKIALETATWERRVRSYDALLHDVIGLAEPK